MIADKDVALLWVKMFTSFNLDREKKQSDNQPLPAFSRIVSPEVSIAQLAAYGGCQSCENGSNGEEREDDEYRIEVVQKGQEQYRY